MAPGMAGLSSTQNGINGGSNKSQDVNPQFWAQGPRICNVDSRMMPHYKVQAVCNYCEDFTIPFATGLGREMRKHYNETHRLLCKVCNRDNFGDKTELEVHALKNHPINLCSKCQAPFVLASAFAMHIDGPRNSCSVSHSALVSALGRVLQSQTTGVTDRVTDLNAVYKPISCSPGGGGVQSNAVQKLKDFRTTLRHAYQLGREMQRDEISNYQSRPPSAAGSGHEIPRALLVIDGSRAARCDDQESSDSLLESPEKWTCTTCDASFTTLSNLLQHVEGKEKNKLWKASMKN